MVNPDTTSARNSHKDLLSQEMRRAIGLLDWILNRHFLICRGICLKPLTALVAYTTAFHLYDDDPVSGMYNDEIGLPLYWQGCVEAGGAYSIQPSQQWNMTNESSKLRNDSNTSRSPQLPLKSAGYSGYMIAITRHRRFVIGRSTGPAPAHQRVGRARTGR